MKCILIEFDGDYWHSGVKANPARELKRENAIKETDLEIEILHIKENEYRNDPERIINQCKDFLLSSTTTWKINDYYNL